MDAAFSHMRRLLGDKFEQPVWPTDASLSPFIPKQHAEPVHKLLAATYETGGGQVAPFAIWWGQLEGDEEYDPALVFLATAADGSLVGVAQCWTSAFIKDLAVAKRWRRHGVATALLLHTFNVFRMRGAPWVDLKVEVGNSSGAERLYRKVGMTPLDVG
jgi:ribosomal protein S18 acetylase RimI-like enzyme